MPELDLSKLSVLNKKDLQRLLYYSVTDGRLVSLAELAKQIGVKGYKLRSAKYWAVRSHLLTQTVTTPLGKLVATKDPYLETTVTDWLMHFHLSLGDCLSQQPPENLMYWEIWTYIVYHFLPDHPIFTLDEVLKSATSIFKNRDNNKLEKSVCLLLKNYTTANAISKCNFLLQESDRFSTSNSDLSNPYTIGYLLAKIWERDFGVRTSVLVDDILNTKLGLANVLGISQEKLRQQLDILAKHEIIEQKSARPHLTGKQTQSSQNTRSLYQVVRCWNNAQELLIKAYENDAVAPNQPLIQALTSILDDDDIPDFSKLLEWASGLIAIDGGLSTRLVS